MFKTNKTKNGYNIALKKNTITISKDNKSETFNGAINVQ